MRALPRVALVVHVVALALWLGGVAMSGLAAAIIFPTMKGLDPRLPEYGSYAGDHWMLAAGKIAARIFHATDVVQGVCAGLGVLSAATLVGVGGVRVRAVAPLGWLAGLAGSLGVLGASLLWLRPRMDGNLRAYWDGALAGDNAAAEAARGAFSADHPVASNLMAATAILVLVTLVAVVAAMTGRAAARSDKPGPPADAGGPSR